MQLIMPDLGIFPREHTAFMFRQRVHVEFRRLLIIRTNIIMWGCSAAKIC